MSSSPALFLRPVTITVPATSANLGPGFDCLGLALELRNELVLHATGPALTNGTAETEYSISVSGLDTDKVPADRQNLAVEAAELLFTRIGCRPAKLAMRMTNGIPVGSGLGSSSSAIIAGLLGADAIFNDPIPRNELLRVAADIEGHPDNVAPALLGGLVLGVLPDDEIGPNELIVRQWDPPALSAVVVLPDFKLLTSEARAVLPSTLSRGDAIFNISRLGLLINALTTSDYSLLRTAMGDRLHQSYRLQIIPGAAEAYKAAYEAGALGVALSGAGPSLIAFCENNQTAIVEAMQHAFAAAGLSSRTWMLKPTAQGACVIRDEG